MVHGVRGTRTTKPPRQKTKNADAPPGVSALVLPHRVTGCSAPVMPLRALKSRYLQPSERPFFTQSGKIFNQINRLPRYTSYKVGKRLRRVPQCPADRMESAKRFRALLSELGLPYPEAAQALHVSLRTVHNWAAGTHPVPYAVTKLLRLLRYMELPGKDWQGWHFTRGHLVTPEGRTIAAHESSWWSLMVLRAQSFGKLYAERQNVAAALKAGYSDACLPISAPQPTPAPRAIPLGNHGDNLSGVVQDWGHNGANVVQSGPSWPLTSDSLSNLIPSPVPTASGSESALMVSLALPLTPIYNSQKTMPLYRLHLSKGSNQTRNLFYPVPKPPQRAQSPVQGLTEKSSSSRLPRGPLQTQSPPCPLTPPSGTAKSSQTGTGGNRSSNQHKGSVL